MYGFTYMRNIKNKKAKLPDRTDKWLLEVRGGKGRGVKWVKGDQNVQTSSYRISKSLGCDTIIVQSLSCVQLFAWSWTVAHQAPVSSTISQSLLKFMSVELVMPSKHLILCHSLLLLPSIFLCDVQHNIKRVFFFRGIHLHSLSLTTLPPLPTFDTAFYFWLFSVIILWPPFRRI